MESSLTLTHSVPCFAVLIALSPGPNAVAISAEPSENFDLRKNARALGSISESLSMFEYV